MTTPEEYQRERDYRVQERLGILCEDRVPTLEEIMLAEEEADAAIKELTDSEDAVN